MERACEFCTSLRPVVYCKADEAYLCLSCDAKVHKANALSSRHLRTLKLHDPSLKHQKRAIRSYMGCPSAKDFAVLWGFELNEIENRSSTDLNAVNLSGKSGDQTGGRSMVSGAKFDGASSSRQSQKLLKDQERQIILQQIIDLKRLQVCENTNHSALINGLQETVSSSSMHHTRKNYDEKCDRHTQNPQDFNNNLQERDSPAAELRLESLSSTFSELDNLPSPPMADLPLNSEVFWTCKSPSQSNQLWSHHIQDLGICEELICQDDFNIPDVDLTFQNFEELFGGDQDPVRGLVGDDDVSCSSIEKDISLDKSDIFNERTMEDSSEAVSMSISQSANEDKDIAPSNQYDPINMDLSQKIRASQSTMSFFVSRFTPENSCTDHHDTGLSPHSEAKGKSSYFLELEVSTMETGGNDTVRIKDKNSHQREKQARGQTRKPGTNVRKRMKGQTAKAESY
ncbi:putative zinc finger protein At1g68190 isoform X2 [Neltuma alba]|uniref:putative zinc finger protein At1g68190 isoform X2 n=1 Tax=Neltuma alba TaxID=207710 RepID=UPI0010A3A46E|nr:putative zinc finger protein At1g68190 isoform X2 [Prosopis alba]